MVVPMSGSFDTLQRDRIKHARVFRSAVIIQCPGCQSRYDVTGRPPGTKARCRCGKVFLLPHPDTRAGFLECPRCGGDVPPDVHDCQYCSAHLKVRACPRCFAKVFEGCKHCNQCGTRIDAPAHAHANGVASTRVCPRCDSDPQLDARLVGDVLLDECPQCHGVWLDVTAVERVIRERRQSSVSEILGMAPRAGQPVASNPSFDTNRMYLKCPDCEQVMNRVNFGRRSGIIVDVCKPHGTWFDANELPRIVEFVSRGGLEAAEQRRLEEMKEEARRAKSQAAMSTAGSGTMSFGFRRSSAVHNVTLFGGLLGAIGSALLD